VLKVLLVVAAMLCLAVGAVLGYVAVIALRRSEGVFLPAGYMALACLAAGVFLGRVALRG
jgi:hypothetical protein